MEPLSAHAPFWQWFQANGDRLRTSMYGQDEEAREEAAAELREAIDEVEPGLILEFSPALRKE